MSAALQPVTAPEACPWPVRELVCGFERPGGGWLEARGRLVGPHDGPAAIVLGGVSAGRGLCPDGEVEGWWPGVAGPGGALDPRRRQLLSIDFLAEDCAPFPAPADQAAAVLALADAAGLERFSLIGASYGGVIALETAVRAPHRVRKLDIFCAAARPNAMTRAWRSIQRETVQLALEAGCGARGVDIARRLAMTSYRTPEEFDARFSHADPASRDAAGVEAYLQARGAAYAAATSPERFLALSRSMDSADVAVERITAPVRFAAFDSDQLVRVSDIEDTAARLPLASVTVIKTRYGHDGFLKETAAVNDFLTARS